MAHGIAWYVCNAHLGSAATVNPESGSGPFHVLFFLDSTWSDRTCVAQTVASVVQIFSATVSEFTPATITTPPSPKVEKRTENMMPMTSVVLCIYVCVMYVLLRARLGYVCMYFLFVWWEFQSREIARCGYYGIFLRYGCVAYSHLQATDACVSRGGPRRYERKTWIGNGLNVEPQCYRASLAGTGRYIAEALALMI